MTTQEQPAAPRGSNSNAAPVRSVEVPAEALPPSEVPVSDTVDPAYRPNQVRLALAQLFSGLGIASGVAVGGLLTEQISGTEELAGLAQTCTVLGAAIVALPLARLAVSRGRRRALTLGFAIGCVGAVLILVAAATSFLPLLLVGMLLFGSATATGLQSRYAATDLAPAHHRGRAMAIVIWATTVGSVAGPNLSEPGARLGQSLGMTSLVGPYLFSVTAFALAAIVASTLRPPRVSHAVVRTHPKVRDCLVAASRNRHATFGLVAIVTGQMMMTSVMVMTPIHMNMEGMALHLIGIVISLHILGMYGLSPLFGWLTDKLGPRMVIGIGMMLFAIAFLVGVLDAQSTSNMPRISTALFLLGTGWSACLIAGSNLLSQSVVEDQRIPMQGAADALMNFGAAGIAAVAGPILTAGGFLWINLTAACILAVLGIAGGRTLVSDRSS